MQVLVLRRVYGDCTAPRSHSLQLKLGVLVWLMLVLCRLLEHWSWLQSQLDDRSQQQEPFWQAMSLVVHQLLGMLQGYNTIAATVEGQQQGLQHISLQEWLALNTMGTLERQQEGLLPLGDLGLCFR